MTDRVMNVVIAGIGGQGVLKASDILAEAVFLTGHDVKKSEVHGMAQRGGSVHSDVRFGPRVFSPMVSPGAAHYLVVLEPSEVEPNRHFLAPTGRLLSPSDVDATALPSKKSLNVALLALLSRELDVPLAVWEAALASQLKPALLPSNLELFRALARPSG